MSEETAMLLVEALQLCGSCLERICGLLAMLIMGKFIKTLFEWTT